MIEYNYSDIFRIDEKGICFLDMRMIEFDECRCEWAKEHNISESDTVCVALRFCEKENCYFIFYSKERVKLFFKHKGIFGKYKIKDKFHEIQSLLNHYGYTSYDMS